MPPIRAAAHVHSEWSYDAGWTLPDLAAAFRRRRYDAVLMSEHDRTFDPHRWAHYREECARASRDILLVPGLEYSNADNTVHTLVWGSAAFLGRDVPADELVGRAHHHGGVAVLAHPHWQNAWRRLAPDTLAALDGVEWWNRRYDGVAPSGLGPQLAATPYVGLDFHTRRQFFPLAMRIDLETAACDARTVEEALRNRRVRAEALRVPVERWSSGGALRALQALDRAEAAAIATTRPARRAWRARRR